ncbi:DUF222 domain-containing protein [Microbacterium sp. 179-B 1A2 NHS]|uniref:HNH endonuclease signature motif containing protein n=1 Tax=Microbacterium sp. 179-B 1A2 NHS TaxID=3142383 RepID=UPI0039A215C9
MTALVPEPGSGARRLAEIVDAVAGRRREIARLQAAEAALLSEAMDVALEQMGPPSRDLDAPYDVPVRSAAAQIAVAVRVSDRTVQAWMDAAHTLCDRFPATHAALGEGRIERSHAQVIAEAGVNILDGESRAEFEGAVLPVAERESANRLRPIARLLAQRIHPIPLADRHRAAATRRGVWLREGVDGMGELGFSGPMVQVAAIKSRLDLLARDVVDARHGRSGGDPGDALEGLNEPCSRDTRSMGEVRFDVAADLLLTGHAAPRDSEDSIPAGDAIRARVQITVPVLTLLGRSDEPAEIVGHGPIDLDTARNLAGDAPGWDRVLTHPVTGCVLAVDRYRPTAEQRRLLAVRDEHCRFPGCRQPAHRCDIDHTIPAEHDGPTEICNLAHLCRRHHTLKHHSAWKVRQHPTGVLEWTSPSGHTVPDIPARTLVFAAVDPPPF